MVGCTAYTVQVRASLKVNHKQCHDMKEPEKVD